MPLSIRSTKDRLDALSQAGCIACRLSFGSFVQNEIQHLTVAGRRVGDRFTIPLCPWHHRGVPSHDFPPAEMERIYGPSFAKSREAFSQAFGHDVFLLEEADKWLGVAEVPNWYQELRSGWHRSHALPSSTSGLSETLTGTESTQREGKSSAGLSSSSSTSDPQAGTKSRASSRGSSKKARSSNAT